MTTSMIYTVSCADSLFGSLSANCGSYPTIEAAIEAAERDKRRMPRSTSHYRIHCNPRGWGLVEEHTVVLCLLF